MNTSNEQSILSELKQICSRLGDAAAGISVDPGASKRKVDGIFAELADLRLRIEDRAVPNS